MKRLVGWVSGLFLLLLLWSGQPVVRAQSDAFISTAVVEYAQNIAFTLHGEMAAPIEQVDLFIQAAQVERPFTVEAIRVNQTGGQLEAAVDIDPTVAELPPFAQVRFWWELQTSGGDTIIVPEETFFYEDNRFTWRELAIGDVTIHWTGNDAELGQVAAEIVTDSRQLLDDILPQTAVSPLNVYIYPAAGDLRTGLRLAGRDWQDGHADPDLGVLLVTAVNPLTAANDLSQSIPHELTHLRLYQLAASNEDADVPLWYEEGMALLAANLTAGDELVATAVANQQTLPLLNLCLGALADDNTIELAQAQSVSLLRYIQAQFGDQALRQLGAAYLAGASCEAGLTQTLEMSSAELNVEWLAAESPTPAWRTFLNQNGLWLLLVLASFCFLALLLRR
ncbi:peptidase MA family metallohydrolase [Candidatus Leptofilum sp.]|uniref:peptidase MA family metallohydrolase n=1 Tax=Candidatus Leptofilum sp. TaxID=3241576 RepID=UPI003B591877